MNYIVIDQGTSSTKAFLFNAHGQFLHTNKIKHALYRPKQFHVESDPSIILNAIKLLFQEMVRTSGKTKIHRAGLAVQDPHFFSGKKRLVSRSRPHSVGRTVAPTELQKSLKSLGGNYGK